MRRWLIVCLLAACERLDSQNPLGTGGANEPAPTGPRAIADAGIATMPNDAARVVVADAKPTPVVVAPKLPPTPKDKVAMNDEDAQAFADKLTWEGPSNIKGDMDVRRRPGADLGQQIQAVKEGNKPIAVGGGTGRAGRGGGGDARVGTNGGTKIAVGDAKDTGPTTRVSVASKRVTNANETSLTIDFALSKIMSAYVAGIRRCYKTALAADPSLKGRITLAFEVDDTGRATNARATGFAKTIDDCIAAQMASWRFMIPKNKDGEPTSTGFEFGLQLVPD